MSINLYEAACERFERISRTYGEIVKAAKATIQWADDEYDAAQKNLRQYESQPGIPLPQYRERYERFPVSPGFGIDTCLYVPVPVEREEAL